MTATIAATIPPILGMRGMVLLVSSARGGLSSLTVVSATPAGSDNSARPAYCAVPGNTREHVQLERASSGWRAAVTGQGLPAAGIAGNRGADHPFHDVRRLPERHQVRQPRLAGACVRNVHDYVASARPGLGDSSG